MLLARAAAQRSLDLAGLLPLAGRRPVNDRGVALDPQVHALISLLARGGQPTLDELGPVRARAAFAKQASLATIP